MYTKSYDPNSHIKQEPLSGGTTQGADLDANGFIKVSKGKRQPFIPSSKLTTNIDERTGIPNPIARQNRMQRY